MEYNPVTGAVDAQTWDQLYEALSSIETTVFDLSVLFPDRADFEATTRPTQYPGYELMPGTTDSGGNAV